MVEENSPHSLSDIIGEIDDMVLKHANTESFSEYNESEQELNESQRTIQNVEDKGHYRGISFGAVPNQEYMPISTGTNKIDTQKYIKLLEDNNEALKRSNEALAIALKEKNTISNLFKAKHQNLIKQNVLVYKTSSINRLR
jgi:hypothetical protein